MAELKLFTFGPPRLERDGQPIDLSLRKALALLIYLTVTAQPQSRDTLATLLWPDSDQRGARGRLRRVLHRLRDEVGEAVVATAADTISLYPTADLWLDCTHFHNHALSGLGANGGGNLSSEQIEYLRAAAALYTDDFLAGWTVADSAAFDEWQFFERERLRQLLAQVLESLVQSYAAQGAWDAAIPYARRWVALDPLHEAAQRELMTAYVWAGQQAAAVRQYKECARILEAELGVAPDEATTALYDAIRFRRFPPQEDDTPTGSRQAAMPFRSQRGDRSTTPGQAVSARGGDDNTQVETSAQTTRTVGREAELQRLHEHLERPVTGMRQMPGTTSALIGREAEEVVVGQLLRREDVRLLTLTGPGGVGKTRLALEVAAANKHWFTDGVAFVALAPLADPALVLPTVARTLGLREAPGHSVTEALITYLHDKRMLLVLDNFEHVLESVPQVVELLSSCPQLVVLVTSRAPLRLRGEQEYAVGPLALPDPKRLPPPEQLGAIASVQLFMQRARQVNPAFDLTSDNAATVAAILRRLDGLPLALELAAARIKLLAPATLLARLDQALLLLVGGARDLPERQQTIRRTIDWSYDLLQPEEQTLFRMLAVFAGGWNLEAAEAVGGAAGDVIDLMGRLVDQSMVIAFDAGIELRYRMLEPVREYALARLAEQGEVDAVKHRHALLYLSLAERAHPELRTNGQVEWMRRLDLELDNLRAAMTWFLEHGAAEEAARMSFALWLFWFGGGYGREGRQYTDAIHAITRQLPPSKRYMSEIASLAMAYNNGDDEATLDYGRLLMEASRQMDRHPHPESFAQAGFGLVALNRGDLETAVAHLEQALALFIESDEQGLAAQTYTWLGTVRMLKGDTEGAQQQLERSLSLARQIGHLYGIYNALFNLAQLALALGDFKLARERFRESMESSEQTRDWANVAYCLEGLATVIGVVGEAEQTVRLLGWAEGLRDSIGVPVWTFYKPDQSLYQQTLKRMREQLGDEAFQRTWAEGHRMTWEQIKAAI